MTLENLFQDNSIKAKAKAKQIAEWLSKNELPLDELLAFTEKQKAADKATCIEGVESATKKNPTIADEGLLAFVTKSLTDEEPRVKCKSHWKYCQTIPNSIGQINQ